MEVLNLDFIWKELTLFLCKGAILGEPFREGRSVQRRGLSAPESWFAALSSGNSSVAQSVSLPPSPKD